ncbi:hypothetical protein R3P38DRAFT_2438051, partial [Favolaschia claudopus]
SIGTLELRQCSLTFEMLQFFAGARIEITTLLLESDGHEYLTYILGNKLGLTAKNVRLIIHP